MKDRRILAIDIERAVDVAASDWRALRRICRPALDPIPGRKTTEGMAPQSFSLDRVLDFLATVGDILTAEVELALREASFEL